LSASLRGKAEKGHCGDDSLEVVVIGPGDLPLSIGIPGDWKDPSVQTEVMRIHEAGKPAMIVALDHDDGRRLLAEGDQASSSSPGC
jgi:2-keto-3-deoxy-L-rhamnonate aldolase RhmA